MPDSRLIAAALIAVGTWLASDAAVEAREPLRPPARPSSAIEAGERGDPDLARILEKAGEYVVEYERRFRDLVAEEEQEQWLEAGISQGQYQPGDVTSRLRAAEGLSRRARTVRRTTLADLVFVPLGPPFLWGTFRDVFEVDGEEVRERDARLERLFLEAGASAAHRAREITEQSEGFNIGTVVRTIDVPTLPLVFLHPQNQARLAFERRGRRQIAGIQAIEVRFEETARPTLVRLGQGADLPARGSFWIDPDHGTVLRTRVEFKSSQSEATVEAEYRSEPVLALWVPSAMEERYAGSGARTRYSSFRRLGATADEGVEAPEAPGPE